MKSILVKFPFVVAILFSVAASLSSQALNPPYLKDMPTVERVMREEQANDPKQTALLQMQALWELEEIVKELSGPREFGRGANWLTPDEQRFIRTYDVALQNLMKDSDAKFPGPYGQWKRFSLNMIQYPRSDPRFGVKETKTFERFLSADIRERFANANGNDAARHKAFQEREQAQMQAAKNAESPTSVVNWSAVSAPLMAHDKLGTSARRCLELGGTELECASKGFLSGIFGLVGLGPDAQPAHVSSGLHMTGIYRTDNGVMLTFNAASVQLSGCGKLVGQNFDYSASVQGNSFLIHVPSKPQPFVVSLAPDNKITGPGLTTVDGKIVTGYRNVVVRQFADDGTVVPYSEHTVKEPIYAAATDRCVIGGLQPAGSVTSFKGAYASTVGFFLGKGSEQASRDAQKVEVPPGMRLGGTYAGQGGLKIEFEPDSAILDCGEAHVARPYQVRNANGKATVAIDNAGAPILLTFREDRSLEGSGTVEVSGRVLLGVTQNGPTFAPKSARCTVSRLTPN